MQFPNLAIAAALTSTFVATSVGAAEPTYFPYPREGVVLGQGWDSLKGQPATDVCVIFEEKEIAAHETSSRYTEVVNRHHLDKLLKVSASASYKGGIVSASGSADYSKQTTINQNRRSILATISVIAGSRYAAPVQSSSNPAPISLLPQFADGGAKRQDPPPDPVTDADFVVRCGDSFVSYIEKGGELNAVFGFSESERKIAESFAIRLKASGYGASGSLNVSTSTTAAELQKFTDIDVIQFGGPRMPSPVKAEDFYETVRAFTAPAGNEDFEEKAFRIAVIPYTSLHNGRSKGRRAEFRALTMLQTLYSELRDSYQEIVTDYVDKGGIVDGRSAYTSDADSKFVILESGDHILIAGNAVDEWRAKARDVSKMGPTITAPLVAEIKRFGASDLMVCGSDIISKYVGPDPASPLAAVPAYLTYLEAKRISAIQYESERLREGNKMRQEISQHPMSVQLAPIMEFVLSGSASTEGAALASIDRCLSFVDKHPWNIDQIEQNYHTLGARILALNNLLENCTDQILTNAAVGECSDQKAIKKFIDETAPRAIEKMSEEQAGGLVALSETAEGKSPEFWMRLTERYGLSPDPNAVSTQISEDVIFQLTGKKDSTTSLSKEALMLPVASKLAAELCEGNGLIPCLTASQKGDQIDFVLSSESGPVTEGGTLELTDKDKADDTIERYVRFYIGMLAKLPPSKSDLVDRTATPPTTTDQAAILTSDLNKFIFKTRLQASVSYICSVIPELKLCSAPAEAITEFEVPAPPVIGRFEVSHDGCRKTAVRRVLDRKRHWVFGGDKYRNETYCADWGKIIDEHEFVRFASQFSRN